MKCIYDTKESLLTLLTKKINFCSFDTDSETKHSYTKYTSNI